jgi:RND family efflux transporter MFP subunit
MSSPTETPPAAPAPRHLRRVGLVAGALLIAVVALGVTQRARSTAALQQWTADQAVPTVTLVKPAAVGDAALLQLSGRLEAQTSAPIYARANGYLKARYVDIGSIVKAGQVLAEIETPDLDQQLQQARADLTSAEANAALAANTAKRWQALRGTNAVSQQEIDEKTGDLTTKQSIVQSQRANVERLAATQGFKRIVAPFDGMVTARSTDVGALIGGSGSGTALFTVADTRTLRVYVQVPQNQAQGIRPGQTAELSLPEFPGRTVSARIERSARAINSSTGAMLVQLAVANTDGSLLPGAYVDVRFKLEGTGHGVTLPASALLFGKDGTQVAVLGADNKVAMKPITISRDLGKTVEIGSGLKADDRVIDNPPDGLSAGDPVRVAQAAKPAAHP